MDFNLKKFRNNKRAFWSFIFLISIFIITLFAEIIANDKPIVMKYGNRFYFPIYQNITEREIGLELETEIDFKDQYVNSFIHKDTRNFLIWPPIKFSYDTINYELQEPSPAAPNIQNLLGTDDQGRDVLSRVIYGVRVSLLFGFSLSILSLFIAIFIGAIQGYFGGKVDIIIQRFTEIWSSMPTLFLLIILSSLIEPRISSLLFLMLLFSWITTSFIVRAEFLRIKNFDYVIAAKAMKASNSRIIIKHILPNAMPLILTNFPFLITSSIITLTSLDFLGLGLPVGSASLGELLNQGKNNLNGYHLALTGFLAISSILVSLIFIAEGVRDALNPLLKENSYS